MTDQHPPGDRPQPDRTGTGTGPLDQWERITSLDLVRGVAVLSMLLMNAVSIKLGLAPYLNLDAGGSETWLDWSVGVFGKILIDQKFMGIFSLLFGAGILLFIERVEARKSHPVLLSLWRNFLLLGIGILHAMLRDGDILTLYAVSAIFLVALRKLPGRALIVLGLVIFLFSVPNLLMMQYIASTTSVPLIGLWDPGPREGPQLLLQMWLDGTMEEGLFLFLCSNMEELHLLGYFLRALGLILMGAGLYRTGFLTGGMPTRVYRQTAAIGLGIGLPLAVGGVVITALGDYSRDVAFIGQIPNTLGSIPAALGLISLLTLWDRSRDNWLKSRLRATGQMALTNYLAQSILGVLILNVLLGDVAVTRTGILVFCLGVWALQLWWSREWLGPFRFGPAEWLWRAATYCRRQPLCRRVVPPPVGQSISV